MAKTRPNIAPEPDADTQKLLHSLRVHQVELEMQNDELRRSHAGLEAAGERFANLYDFAPCPLLTLGPDGEVLEANLAAAKLLGVARAALLRKRLASFIPAEVSDAFFLYCQRVVRSGSGPAAEFKARSADGRALTLLLKGAAVEDAATGKTHCRLSLTDIAEIKLADEKLRQLSAAVEQSPVSTIITNADGAIEYANLKFTALAGFTQAEVLGRNLRFQQTGNISPTTYRELWQVVTAGIVWRGDLHSRKKNGEIYWEDVTISPIRDAAGVITHFLVINEDITNRKHAEAEIRQQAALISSLLDSIPDIVFFKNKEGVYLGCNPRFAEFVGRPRNEIVGQTDHELFDREIADSFREHDQQVLAACEPRQNEEWITYPDGRRVLLDTLKAPYWGPDGSLVGVLGISRDITAQKQAAEQLRQANQSLEEANVSTRALAEQADAANRAKSDFLAMMSHEIRTPMNAVLGMTSLLLNTPLDVRQTEFARTVATSGEALLDIINEILDFSKIEAGEHFQLDEEVFDLRKLVGGVLQLLEPRATERGLALAVELAEGLPDCLRGDDGRLRQVLMNLVGNAIKFTEQGGVKVRVQRLGAEDRRIRLRFEVTDTGIGISAEETARLFQPFTQVDSSASRRRGGTGLGLAISKRIVELMGGSIGVASVAGQGSTFWFEVVLEAAQAPATGAEEVEVSELAGGAIVAPGRPLRLLVAEDHAPNRRLVMYMLESLGCTADFAGNGLEAVAMWERSDPDLIIMDCHMPEMDGFEATREIRRREAARSVAGGKHVRIVALTANALKGDRESCLAAGMDDYLSKPYTAQQLGAVLNRRPVRSGKTAPAPTGPTLPVVAGFDPQCPTQLCADLGEEDVQKIIEDFLQDLPQRAAEMEPLAAAGQWQELARLAHSLQGIGRTLGLEGFSAELRSLEAAAGAGDRAAVTPWLRSLPGGVEQSIAAIRGWQAARRP